AVKEFMTVEGFTGYDEDKRSGDIRHIVAREVEGKYVVTIVATHNLPLEALADRLAKQFKKFTLLLNVNTTNGNVIFGKEWHICRGEGFFYGEDEGIKYKAGANTFLQVNDGVKKLLYRSIVGTLREKNTVAIDLYSGGGLLTAMLSKACKQAYGIEVVKEAVDCADELKKINGLDNMFNVCGTVEGNIDEVLKKTEGCNRAIVCDPPRKGMERSVVKAILSSGADKVVLVSCNPATLARDLGLLCGSLTETDGQLIKNPAYCGDPLSGFYEIVSVTPYDMFPQTKHVETLVVLTKKA
ncbi:MAG: hypothetical protein K2N47_03165, partial [Clostridia bacterium]|nr:hypothetical protein [Clostridia bacterium]